MCNLNDTIIISKEVDIIGWQSKQERWDNKTEKGKTEIERQIKKEGREEIHERYWWMTYSLILIDNVRSALCIAIKLHVEEKYYFL